MRYKESYQSIKSICSTTTTVDLCDVYIANRIYISVTNDSAEVTTVSLSLRTDRTLSLRAHKEIAESVLTLKCHGRLKKYNATREEIVCVCAANCPWRSLTDEELEIRKQSRALIIWKDFVRKLAFGIYNIEMEEKISQMILRGETSMLTKLEDILTARDNALESRLLRYIKEGDR